MRVVLVVLVVLVIAVLVVVWLLIITGGRPLSWRVCSVCQEPYRSRKSYSPTDMCPQCHVLTQQLGK